MTYGELKIKLYFAYADLHGVICEIPSALYFAVVDIANSVGCDHIAEPGILISELESRQFSERCIEAVLDVIKTQPLPVMA